MGFTPDNKFHAIYGERGRMSLEIKARAQGLEIKYLRKDLWELKNPESTCVQVLNKAYNKVMKEDVIK